MLFTIAWKEFRDHWSIWTTMILMTGVLTFGLGRLISPGSVGGLEVATLTVLGMAAAYGVVCGAMMLAGEWENGTLMFLDVFLGRRGLLWLWKLLIGAVFALTEGLAVALALYFAKQDPPEWLARFIGQGNEFLFDPLARRPSPGPSLWLWVLPLVTLEAYAWGLLGSSMTRLVLTGAALATVIAAPLWLIAIVTPAPMFLGIRLVGVGMALVISCTNFLAQAREPQGPSRPPEPAPREDWLDDWEEDGMYDPGYDMVSGGVVSGESSAHTPPPATHYAPRTARRSPAMVLLEEPIPQEPTHHSPLTTHHSRPAEADSPSEVLLWLTFQQGGILLGILGGAGFLLGLFLPSHGQVLWPLATLLLGLACGTAAFAREQSDLSYQFLAAQHFSLSTVWSVKVFFWLIAGVLLAVVFAAGGSLVVLGRIVAPPRFDPAQRLPVGFEFGTLRELMGSLVFFGVWFVYGFCTALVFVWLCRKTILALLLAAMVSVVALGMWLPSLLCRGMSGWQVWVPPLAVLVATGCLVRAWAGGRIKERRPVTALIGVGLAAMAWVFLNYGYRAWEISDVGEPLDRAAFRASIPTAEANAAGKKIQEALALAKMDKHDLPGDGQKSLLAEAARLPVGVIEAPPGDGQAPLLRHIDPCRELSRKFHNLADTSLRERQSASAVNYQAQILALSRNLRNKAPLPAYLAGVKMEEGALSGLDRWLSRGQPDADLLRRVLAELNRHAAETPPAADCLRTECFRGGGALNNAAHWTFFFFSDPKHSGQMPERGLAGWIALSLEMPWEAERKTRLWRAVWGGLFRGIETPHWQLPEAPENLETGKEITRTILQGWLPEPESSLTRARLAALLDASWLADERLFTSVVPLREAATRARCRVGAYRLKLALALYQVQEKKTPQKLDDLVPKYLAELPVDPYSGQLFHYRISAGENLDVVGRGHERVQPGQGILWSTGPDRVDHGGRKDGSNLAEADPQWSRGGFDLISVVPHWP